MIVLVSSVDGSLTEMIRSVMESLRAAPRQLAPPHEVRGPVVLDRREVPVLRRESGRIG
jgi:hypothetical protein